jgi:hypothetical protein
LNDVSDACGMFRFFNGWVPFSVLCCVTVGFLSGDVVVDGNVSLLLSPPKSDDVLSFALIDVSLDDSDDVAGIRCGLRRVSVSVSVTRSG